MGFLAVGEPLEWADSREKAIKYVRKHGIAQFIAMYDKVKGIENDELMWGDEVRPAVLVWRCAQPCLFVDAPVWPGGPASRSLGPNDRPRIAQVEYGIFQVDDEAGTVKIKLRGAEVLAELQKREASVDPTLEGLEGGCSWVPEYGSWMLEGTPSSPYSGYAADLLRVETNMRLRRSRILAALRPGEVCPTMPCFPMLGVGEFVEPAAPPGGPIAQSFFVPDSVINPHPRFGALTRNIRSRRGAKVDIRIPRYHDTRTPVGTPVGAPPPTSLQEAMAMDEVYMDAMAFGMGCCCLQVTFQARDVAESRHLYDHLAVLSPILLALTAATPIARGALLDRDARWDIISSAVDDRTPAERSGARDLPAAAPTADDVYHGEMAGGGKRPLPKSRYSSISSYICTHLTSEKSECMSSLNDLDAPIDEAAYKDLIEGGVDSLLAKHIAHLFVRDPLVIFHGRIELNDNEQIEHFENLQSTNWQTVRWKPPPASSKRLGGDLHIGWRVEFRSMEVQLTDFENAAFTVFIVLASRVILYFNLNLYLPLSKVDENMRRAQKVDALRTEKFYFRQGLHEQNCDTHGKPVAHSAKRQRRQSDPKAAEAQFGQGCKSTEMTVREILMGNGDYRGLVPMILAYLHSIGTDSQSLKQIENYMDFIVARASGELMTPAAWMRNFVRNHPDYKQDSVVSHRVAADLVAKCHAIGTGAERCAELHGAFGIVPVSGDDAYAAPLLADMPQERSAAQLGVLVDHYKQRSELVATKRRLENRIDELGYQLSSTREELEQVKLQLKAQQRL